MLSPDDLARLLLTVGEEIESANLSELAAGIIVKAYTTWHETCFFEPEGGLVNIYTYDGEKRKFENAYRGSFPLSEKIKLDMSVLFGGYYTGLITSLRKICVT